MCRVCLINSLSWTFLFNQNFVVVKIPCIGKLTNKYFISRVITFFCLSICNLSVHLRFLVSFFVLYVYGRKSKLFSFLFMNLAMLYDGASVLFTTGLIGSLSLCVFMHLLSFVAVGFIFTKYLCDCLSTSVLHFWSACWICFWYVSEESLFNCFMLFSCIIRIYFLF